jgi:hypothetical protein
MAQGRPSKQTRVGGAYHDSIPFQDDFSIVHAREGRLLHVSNDLQTAPAERSQHEADHVWNSASSWLPIDDPDYALEPDGEWYDEVLGADIMNPAIPDPTAQKKKRIQSNVSVRRPFRPCFLAPAFFCRKGLTSSGRMSTTKCTWTRSSGGLEREIFMVPWNVQIVGYVGAQWLGCWNIVVRSALSLTSHAKFAV